MIDALLEQADGRDRRGVWEVVVATLAVFHDPRVVEFFKQLLRTGRRARTLYTAAARLGQEPLAPLREFARPLLMQNESDAHARAAARLLLRAPDLDPAARLRAALLAGRGRLLPASITMETAADWLAELAGLFAPLARQALEAQGQPALLVLTALWQQLGESERAWLLRWSAAQSVDPAVALCAKAIASGAPDVMLPALKCVAALGERAAVLAPALAAVANGPDPTLRLAAIQAGAVGVDFRTMIATEPLPALRRACVTALARQEGAAAVPDLLAARRDPHWSVREAATDAMRALARDGSLEEELLV